VLKRRIDVPPVRAFNGRRKAEPWPKTTPGRHRLVSDPEMLAITPAA